MSGQENRRGVMLLLLALAFGLAVSGGTGARAAAPAPPPGSLYARLGGGPVVERLTSLLIDQLVADPQLNQSFKGTNLKRVKAMLAEQICALAGGGCIYSGDSMREVHAGHHISEREFYGLVELLRADMRRLGIRVRERNQLLALLAPMKSDVVDVTVPAP